MALKYNLELDKGATFSTTFNVKHQTTGNPVDLSGYDIASHIRANFSDILPTAIFTASIDTPRESGSFSLGLHASGSFPLTGSCYFYDVELTQGEFVWRVVEGKLLVNPEVTQ